jgi:hypothetical protein
LMIEDGPSAWFKLRHICDLTRQSPELVAGILHRLRARGRLGFERRCPEVRAEFRFTIPTDLSAPVERVRVGHQASRAGCDPR